jgi:hypothetical protein
MSETLAPFHEQAQEVGRFLLAARERDAKAEASASRPAGPSENTD